MKNLLTSFHVKGCLQCLTFLHFPSLRTHSLRTWWAFKHTVPTLTAESIPLFALRGLDLHYRTSMSKDCNCKMVHGAVISLQTRILERDAYRKSNRFSKFIPIFKTSFRWSERHGVQAPFVKLPSPNRESHEVRMKPRLCHTATGGAQEFETACHAKVHWMRSPIVHWHLILKIMKVLCCQTIHWGSEESICDYLLSMDSIFLTVVNEGSFAARVKKNSGRIRNCR